MQSARLPSPPPTPNLPPAGPSVTLTGPNAGHDDLHGPSALHPMRRAKTGIPYASLAVTTASFPGDEMADNRTGPQALPKGPTPPHDEYDVHSPLHNLTDIHSHCRLHHTIKAPILLLSATGRSSHKISSKRAQLDAGKARIETASAHGVCAPCSTGYARRGDWCKERPGMGDKDGDKRDWEQDAVLFAVLHWMQSPTRSVVDLLSTGLGRNHHVMPPGC
jgi:hypothetical protein